MTGDVGTTAALIAAAAAFFAGIVSLFTGSVLRRRFDEEREVMREEFSRQMSLSRSEITHSVNNAVSALGSTLSDGQRRSGELQDKRIEELTARLSERQEQLQKTVSEQLARVEARFEGFTRQSEQRLEALRTAVEGRLDAIGQDNAKKLEQMRQTVDEKLQKTLDERLAHSFSQVSDRLEQVYKGLGEMQTLAAGVGDLKKVLSNVKTRGILGEIQLGAILDQMLSPEQYAANVATRPNSRNVVEYAVKLPGDGEQSVWLPIDSKFPGETYSALMDAYESGSTERVAAATRELENRILLCAKDIREKYIEPPFTTDFAILFLPFEGLYAEVVRRGMVERLQELHINIAGPTTMAALLNALQMGFRTLVIQKRTSEVWQVLGAVKTEFSNFAGALKKAQERIRMTGEEIDRLVGARTRAMQRKLRDVTELPNLQSQELLGLSDGGEFEEGSETDE